VLAILGVPVTVVFEVLVVTVLSRLMAACERVDVRMLPFVHAMLRVTHHRVRTSSFG
jgi:hypothetical protein